MATSTTIQVIAPGAGESVTEGTILEWHVQEGDRIEVDATLVEISTDKVDVEVPAPAAGTVVRLHVAEGDTITVGALLAEIEPGGAGSESGDAPAESDDRVDGAADGQADGNGTAPAAGGPSTGEILDIVTPGAGESVTEGTLLEWHVAQGDSVTADQTIVEISTDKVDVELPAPAAGSITELLAAEGETVTVGQVIARMTTSAGAPAPAPAGGDGAPAAARPAAAPAAPTASATPAADLKASPVARRIAAHEGVDLATVPGSGPDGRITKQDVLGVKEGTRRPASAPAASGNGAAPAARPDNATLLRGGAATLARYMDESRAIPTATSFRTLTVTQMDGRRKQLKEGGQKVSFTHLIAYAIALAVQQEMPVMARHFADIDGKPHVIDDDAVHLGIAVDVTTKKGRTLMVPVIKDAGRRSFADFKAAFDDLIARARENKLTAEDLQGANVSLTNPGGIGTVASVPRLMTGQGTIIATGSIAYPVGLGAIGDMIGAEKVMTMTSTYDHRIIQGAESGQFLKVVEDFLQGENGFYDGVFASLDVALGSAPQVPAPAAAAAAAREGAAARATGRDDGVADGMPSEELLQAVQAATSLLKAHRTHGHLAARLDPLGTEPEGDPALDPEPLGLTPELMAKIPAKILRMHVPGSTLADALPHLRETYCGTIAYEIEHIASHRQRTWLRQRIESGAFRSPLTNDEAKALLKRLVEVDAFERFMHKAYLGQKQFSVEGLDMTVPMIDEMIQLSAAHGAREVVVGMAHRGRLNVLAHNLGRPYETIFAEFEGASTLEAITTIPQGGRATSSTTTAPRAPTGWPTASPSSSTSSPTRPTWSTCIPSCSAPPARRRRRARARTRTVTPPRRCPSSCTATRPSRARASWRSR
jgi:2-oxoglutarate dehydrogenase E1 component